MLVQGNGAPGGGAARDPVRRPRIEREGRSLAKVGMAGIAGGGGPEGIHARAWCVDTHPGLDNPFWSALHSLHRGIGRTAGEAARYPAEFAPFLGVAGVDADPAGLPDLVEPDEAVYLLGVAPRRLPRHWTLEAFAPLAQLACDAPIDLPDGPPMRWLDDRHRGDVLALTALVYPHYFRARTMELGRYFGILRDGRLAAMIGERLGCDDARELSAICTHPDFLGLGYARRLTAMLANDTLAQGRLPFLHVAHGNGRAKALYERLGFRHRRDIGFWRLHRPA